LSFYTKYKSDKVTKLEKLQSKDQIREYLEINPSKYVDVLGELQDRLNKSHIEKLGMEGQILFLVYEYYRFKNKKDLEIQVKSVAYEHHHSGITIKIHYYLLKFGTFPTTQHYAIKTKNPTTFVIGFSWSGLANKVHL